MTTAVAPVARIEGRIPARSTVLALARFEGRLLVRHPVTLIGALASTGWAIFELGDEAAVLNRASVILAWTMLPLAVGVALVAGWAVLRASGQSDTQPTAVMPLGMNCRAAGIVMGLAFPAALALILQLLLLAWLQFRDPVTAIVWTEFFLGPAYVVFAGVWVAAITRWIAHPATPLLAVLSLAGLVLAFPDRLENWGRVIGIEWLSPFARPQDLISYELAFRPAALHLGYLFGLIMVVSGVAILGRWVSGWAILLGGLLIAATLGPAQLGPIAESRQLEAIGRLVGDQAALTCETHDEVEYCALAGYEGWIDDWVEASVPVLAAAPTAEVQAIAVRQYPVYASHLSPDDINNWRWFALSHRDLVQRPKVVPVGSIWNTYIGGDLARDTASVLVGCESLCAGEAQLVVYLWLAAHHPEIRSIVEGNLSSEGTPQIENCIVAELWAQPDARALIHANWATLTNPATTYQEAASLLGREIGCP